MSENTKQAALIIVGIVLVIAGVYIVFSRSLPGHNGLTDEQIKEQFNCNRVTADVRKTDVYCSDPGLYREHLQNNTVIN
jgi:hypothetical protein